MNYSCTSPFFITSQQSILNSKNNFHHLKKKQVEVFNSDWNIQKNASFIVYFTKKLLSFMKILGNKLVDSEYKIGFYMQLTRRMFWHFFGWNFEKNHSAFLLGLRKTVRTTAFYSTLHTEHLPMSYSGSTFFLSCINLRGVIRI